MYKPLQRLPGNARRDRFLKSYKFRLQRRGHQPRKEDPRHSSKEFQNRICITSRHINSNVGLAGSSGILRTTKSVLQNPGLRVQLTSQVFEYFGPTPEHFGREQFNQNFVAQQSVA